MRCRRSAPWSAIVVERRRRRRVVFLIMVQGSFRKGYTDLDFNHVLGTMIKGSAEEETGASEALGVVGDTAGPTGLYATLAGAVVLMLRSTALVITPLVRRHWAIQGLVLGAVTALVVGLVFCGVADARLDTPTGLFGVDAGGITPVVIVLCSLGFGLVGARCYSLDREPGLVGGARGGRRRGDRERRRARALRALTRTPRRGARTGPRGRLR